MIFSEHLQHRWPCAWSFIAIHQQMYYIDLCSKTFSPRLTNHMYCDSNILPSNNIVYYWLLNLYGEMLLGMSYKAMCISMSFQFELHMYKWVPSNISPYRFNNLFITNFHIADYQILLSVSYKHLHETRRK